MTDADDAEDALKKTSPYFQWLVYNARDWWRWLTTWWSAAGIGALEYIALNWDDLSKYIPARYLAHAGAAALAVNFILRLYNQRKP